MTEEIKYNKDEKWVSYEQLAETPQQTIARLEQENKELKIYIESNKQQVEEVETLVMDNDRLRQEVENLKDIIYYDVEKYRSALEEIREIAMGIMDDDIDEGSAYYDADQIINKINEVLK